MKLGFLTACMPERALEEIARWAGAHGFEALEVAAWPGLGDRPFTATPPRRRRLRRRRGRARAQALFDGHGLELSALAYYDNNLHPDPDRARGDPRAPARAASTPRRRSAASRSGTFVGRDPRRSASPRTCARPSRCSRRSSTTPASAGVQADHRELRDGGLAPRRLPRQPRLLARAVGVDVLDSGCTSTTTRRTCCGWGSTRSRRCGPTSTGSPTRRPRTSRRSPPSATATAARPRRPRATTPGTWAGGGTASRASARSTWRALRRRALRGRLRRRAVGRARGPGVGRHRGEGRGRACEIAHRNLRPLVVA